MAVEREALAAWLGSRRAQAGSTAWRLDLIEALSARAAAHGGQARQLVDARIEALVAECDASHAALSVAQADTDGDAGPGQALAARRGAVRQLDLVAYLAAVKQFDGPEQGQQPGLPAGATAGHAIDTAGALAPVHARMEPVARGSTQAGADLDAGVVAASGVAPDAATDATAGAPADAATRGWDPLPALEQSRLTWARIRTGSQLRQSLEQLDEDAGPLNSGRLVHRALSLMQQCAPGYLEHFVAYVDALSSLESLRAAPAAEPRMVAGGTGKAPRARTRKRRE